MNDKILFPVTVLMLLILAGSAYAQVSYFPQQFYGSVSVNGVPSPDGVLISAKHNGKDVEGGLTAEGKYGHGSPAFIVALHSQYEGDTIEFYVQNVKAAEYTFTAGESTELDLSVTIPNFCGDGKCESGESCSSCSKDCGTCTQTGGGGGPSGGIITGGGTTSEEQEEEQSECVEDWICTDWSECFNYKQSRTCADINRCGTTENKPVERQDCEMTIICEPEQRMCRGDVLMLCSSFGTTWVDWQTCEFGCYNGECLEKGEFPLAGMFTGLPATVGAVLGLVIIIILGLYFGKIRRK